MMFLDQPGAAAVMAISQPAHAWVAGQLLSAWQGGLDPTLLLAAEQHDLAWLDWERKPVFDPATGRPTLFRDVGAADHAPVWATAIDRALHAWGSRVALMISRHGSVIYTRFTDRHRAGPADADAAAAYLARQAPQEAAWAAALGLPAAALARDTDLIAFADTLSLGLCGALPLPLETAGPGTQTGTVSYRLAHGAGGCTLAPWPFAQDRLAIGVEARPLPASRFTDEAAMLSWVASPARTMLTLRLARQSVSQPDTAG